MKILKNLKKEDKFYYWFRLKKEAQIISKERNDKWNENYYIQASAYAEKYEERTGTPISQIVILVVTEDGTVQEFVREKTEEYLDMLSSALQDFNKTSLSYISN